MKLDITDFPKLRVSLLSAIIMIGLGVSAVLFSYQSAKAAQASRNAALTERNELEGKLSRVRSEENEIKQKSIVFNKLQTRGIIGDEQRLEWVELLKAIRDERRLLDLQYEFSPQRPLDATTAGGYTFFASSMRAQLKLLHEEDLTRFLNDLQERARALIHTKRCTITKSGSGRSESAPPIQLQAECLIDWVTLNETPAKK